MKLTERITKDLTDAMKAREALRTSVLRMAKAAVKNLEIEKREALDDAEVLELLHGLVKQREDSAEQFRKGGRPELADKEEAEISILKAYLPERISQEEIAQAVGRAVSETGAASPRDLGKVMKAALAALRETGKSVDGKRVNEEARRRLGG
jgi:uncharacterized protein YqeY